MLSRDQFDDLSLASLELRPLAPGGSKADNTPGMLRSQTSVKFNEAFDAQSFGDYSIQPEQASSISFPKIKAPRVPNDTLSAIKGNLYKPSSTSKSKK